MNILAFDSSGQGFSAALLSDGIVLCEETFGGAETHARHIMPVLDRVLMSSGMTARDLGSLAVTVGPGSFTGLRIGLGVAKGISHALDIPIRGISTLDAMAWRFRDSVKPVHVLLDARRGEVYTSGYVFLNGKIAEKTAEKACSPEEAVNGAFGDSLFCGSGASVYRQRIESATGFRINPLNPDSEIKASDVAVLAYLQNGVTRNQNASDIRPIYLRRSEAEINYEIRNRPV